MFTPLSAVYVWLHFIVAGSCCLALLLAACGTVPPSRVQVGHSPASASRESESTTPTRLAAPATLTTTSCLPNLSSTTPHFSLTAPMHLMRPAVTAILLRDGRIFVLSNTSATERRGEIYDPRTNTWMLTQPMQTDRYGQSSLLLSDGQVLLVGGWSAAGAVETVERYSPSSDTWTTVAPLPAQDQSGTAHAVMLANGQVLAVTRHWAQRYDPRTDTWTMTSPKQTAAYEDVLLLPDGRVLAMNETIPSTSGLVPHAIAELYDPRQDRWHVTTPMHRPRQGYTVTLLNDGRVLAIGGDASGTVELYDPRTETWMDVAPLPQPRFSHGATLLQNGMVVVVGGQTGQETSTPLLRSVLLYDPAHNIWHPWGDLQVARWHSTVLPLLDNRLFVIGGTVEGEHARQAEVAMVCVP